MHRSEKEFDIGDYVYVNLQPYRQNSVVTRANQKLSLKYYGPYRIIDNCCWVAYKLDLPTTSKSYLVFCVSQLEVLFVNILIPSTLQSSVSTVLIKEPDTILKRKMVQH